MKRILAWTLALTMGLSLCACGTDSSSVSTSQTTDTVAEQTPAAETSDTIEIGTAEELVTFAKSVTDGSKGGHAGQTVVLTADIDCSDVEWTLIGTMNLEDMSDYSEAAALPSREHIPSCSKKAADIQLLENQQRAVNWKPA